MIDFFIVEEPFDSQKHSENVGKKNLKRRFLNAPRAEYIVRFKHLK